MVILGKKFVISGLCFLIVGCAVCPATTLLHTIYYEQFHPEPRTGGNRKLLGL